jgi:hypothetical protein
MNTEQREDLIDSIADKMVDSIELSDLISHFYETQVHWMRNECTDQELFGLADNYGVDYEDLESD